MPKLTNGGGSKFPCLNLYYKMAEVETARSTTTIPTPFTSLITMGAKNGRLSNSDIKDLEKSTYCK
ncbi:hypothetical protein T02_15797 [Trichinella nativa]|uniref:Uncharacterized protein n=1 Tax=Trichinella nativa TaxID=6335 RepID=A0A0V1KUW2_9BILA|nr:hypothetical protein T02_15797 [Trichinella nativa]